MLDSDLKAFIIQQMGGQGQAAEGSELWWAWSRETIATPLGQNLTLASFFKFTRILYAPCGRDSWSSALHSVFHLSSNSIDGLLGRTGDKFCMYSHCKTSGGRITSGLLRTVLPMWCRFQTCDRWRSRHRFIAPHQTGKPRAWGRCVGGWVSEWGSGCTEEGGEKALHTTSTHTAHSCFSCTKPPVQRVRGWAHSGQLPDV